MRVFVRQQGLAEEALVDLLHLSDLILLGEDDRLTQLGDPRVLGTPLREHRHGHS